LAPVLFVFILPACYSDTELQSCTHSPTACDDGPATAAQPGSTSSSSGETGGGGTVPTTGAPATTTTDGATSTGEQPETTGESEDPPPWVSDVACDPPIAKEVGPTHVSYVTSDDAVEAELLREGVVIDTRPVGEPLVFAITGVKNNPGSALTVRVRDVGGQTAESPPVYQPSEVPPAGEIWQTLEPNDGEHSMGGGAAIQDGHALAAGVLYQAGQLVGTLRRYDDSGKWKPPADGWSKSHPTWTTSDELKAGSLGPSALAVDSDGAIILAATVFHTLEPRMYVARFHPNGDRHWEVLENEGTEARGVGVQLDGTIHVTGARRTSKVPERWDMVTWTYSADKTAHGFDVFSDPTDYEKTRSERGHGVARLKDGRIVVVGTREFRDLDYNVYPRGVALLYEAKGIRVGEWTAPADKGLVNTLNAVAATDDGFVACGYAQADPNSKAQLLVRWLDANLTEIKTPRLETTPGASVCNAVGYSRDGLTLVGGSVVETGFGANAWIFAVKDASDPAVEYLKLDGPTNGEDRVNALYCDYACAWTGSLQVGNAFQWITGMIRP